MKKTLITIVLIYCCILSNAQLTFIGNDNVETKKSSNKIDGYELGVGTTGYVTMGGLYYFITPNGKLIETDGSAKKTKTITNFKPQSTPFLKATNKFVYFAKDYDGGAVQYLYQYSPSSGINLVFESGTQKDFYINGNLAGNVTADNFFVDYEKNNLLIRKFTNNNFYIYIVKDNNSAAIAYLVDSKKLNMSNLQLPISTNTSIEAFKNDIYWNGRVKNDKDYETNTTVFKEANYNKYQFKLDYTLSKRKTVIFDSFLRTKNKIYSLLKVYDSVRKNSYFDLCYYEGKQLFGTTSEKMYFLDENNVSAQVINGEIYISSKNQLYVYNEEKENYYEILNQTKTNSNWSPITNNNRFLNIENYYLTMDNKNYVLYHTGKLSEQNLQILPPNQPNHYPLHKPTVYAGKNSFYFVGNSNGTTNFVRYNLTNHQTTPIVFPEFKKEKFEKINAIFQDNQNSKQLIFLTKYISKKDKPVYKMFFYNEDGETLIRKKYEILDDLNNDEDDDFFNELFNNKSTNTNKEIDVFEITSFDKKLFIEQLAKIVNNQDNQFKDIIGATLPGLTDEFKCTVELKGFKNLRLIDFKKYSSLIRFQAETNSIIGRSKGLEALNVLDAEVQNLLKGYNVKREIDTDVASRKVINYLKTDGKKLLQLDLDSDSNTSDIEKSIYKIVIRADKTAW